MPAAVEVTLSSMAVAIAGLFVMGILFVAQLVAVISPRGSWTVDNVYGGSPGPTDATAYFAFNQGLAWADVFLWAPIQFAGSVGMLLGRRWGFLLALMASVPFVYTGVTIFIWDRDLGFRKSTFTYWVFVWGMFPVFGVVEATYCFARLMG
jgi:hypothetical protein